MLTHCNPCSQVVPQIIMSDLPLVPHILFRLAHVVGSASMYVNVVGHSLLYAVARVSYVLVIVAYK